MLVVNEIIPDGVSDGKLEIGDILVQVNGDYVTEFVPLEAVLDDRVGEPLQLLVERNGQPRTVDMEVEDHKDKVYLALAEAIKKDKSKTNILQITELGLIEMTRKRVKPLLREWANFIWIFWWIA